MVALETPICNFGWKAPDFSLKGIDEKDYNFSDIKGKIGDYCLVGANTLITEGKEFPDNSLIVGSPGKVKRELTDIEKKMIDLSALHYVENMKRFKLQLEENTKKYE